MQRYTFSSNYPLSAPKTFKKLGFFGISLIRFTPSKPRVLTEGSGSLNGAKADRSPCILAPLHPCISPFSPSYTLIHYYNNYYYYYINILFYIFHHYIYYTTLCKAASHARLQGSTYDCQQMNLMAQELSRFTIDTDTPLPDKPWIFRRNLWSFRISS